MQPGFFLSCFICGVRFRCIQSFEEQREERKFPATESLRHVDVEFTTAKSSQDGGVVSRDTLLFYILEITVRRFLQAGELIVAITGLYAEKPKTSRFEAKGF